MTYTLELPPEAEKTIKDLGYDVKSYFDVFFLKPLLNEMKKAKINKIIERKQDEIDTQLQTVKDEVVFKKKLEVGEEKISEQSL